MENNITELVFILDRSGSMAGLESDTIGGFNSMIEKQKKESGRAMVTTVLFDNSYELLHDRVDLKNISPMTQKDYWVRGSTALVDAIGRTIDHISDIHKYIRPEDVPERTVFVITTDGMENASHTYSADRVRGMIEKKRGEGWEFIFLGANIDAAAEAARFGISASRAARYEPDCAGTALNYEVVSETVAKMRMCDTMEMDALFEEKDALGAIRENYARKHGLFSKKR
jgi:uncharacterized protein YegL